MGKYLWPPFEISSTVGRTTVHSGWPCFTCPSQRDIRSCQPGLRRSSPASNSRVWRKISARFISCSGVYTATFASYESLRNANMR